MEEQQKQTVNLSQDAIIQAATAGVQLLQTPGAVNVPGPMAITGIAQTLHSLLVAIVNKQVVVLQTKVPVEIPSEGEGDKKPQLKPVEGKKAEK